MTKSESLPGNSSVRAASSLDFGIYIGHIRQFKQRWHRLVFLIALSVLLCSQFSGYRKIGTLSGLKLSNGDSWTSITRDFQWRDLEPRQSLQYSPCFGSYQCARLSVPLNWNITTAEREDGPRVAIAIIKLPAKVPVTDPRYGGPVILNPGGPGESGIYQVLSDGKSIQTIVDHPVAPTEAKLNSTNGKYFDILSFDPRGVNNTTPRLRCFPNAFNQRFWALTYADYGLLWDSESIIGMEWARAAALGASCSQEEEGNEILPYINTAQVVEDIVEIIEREGEWRAKETQKLLFDQEQINRSNSLAALKWAAYHPGQEKLQYWGMSFGTIIGSTFSAMHPERVGRVVIDGVVDPADHYSGGWLTQLQDSDQIITEFSKNCFQAGPDKCSLYMESSAADIERRFTSVLMSLKQNPIPVILPAADLNNSNIFHGPDLITYGDAHLYLLSGMYFSFAMAEQLFNLVHALESKNTTSPRLANILASKQAIFNLDECQQSDTVSDPCIPYTSMMGSFQSISCMDSGGGPSNLTRHEFRKFLVELKAQSQWISPNWARNKLSCLGHSASPAWKPDLDFVTQKWDNTSHPLLIIGNSHDTVTPIGNAHRVATLFPRSVVLHQDSEGHCSHSNPSLCTGKVVREYFQTGKLPSRGTVCEPEFRPFVGCVKKNGCHIVDEEEKKLWEAMVELADPFSLTKKMSYARESKVLQKLMLIS
jgi:pimeloyl-ACP methyl ester carboxylesterase